MSTSYGALAQGTGFFNALGEANRFVRHDSAPEGNAQEFNQNFLNVNPLIDSNQYLAHRMLSSIQILEYPSISWI
jgi:hypothetical protein